MTKLLYLDDTVSMILYSVEIEKFVAKIFWSADLNPDEVFDPWGPT